MTKKITPLEALKRLRSHNYHEHSKKECLDIIETALEDYEGLKTSYLENLLNEESKEYIYKKLKALEIIARNCSFSFKEVTKPLFEHYQVIIDCGVESIRIIIPPERKADYELLEEVLL